MVLFGDRNHDCRAGYQSDGSHDYGISDPLDFALGFCAANQVVRSTEDASE